MLAYLCPPSDVAWMLHWFFFVGALAYADDLVLLAPTHAMRQLLRICDEYCRVLARYLKLWVPG